VETEFGFHLVQVTDRKPGTPATYAAAATDVLDAYADDFRADLIAKLRKQGADRGHSALGVASRQVVKS
jgi:peptidyl-prolyl cis-trans isomerase C